MKKQPEATEKQARRKRHDFRQRIAEKSDFSHMIADKNAILVRGSLKTTRFSSECRKKRGVIVRNAIFVK